MEPMLKLTKLNIFTCDQCQRIFTSVGQLKKHEQTHIHIYSAHVLLKRIQTFDCKECKKCFTNVRDCYLHELMHSEVKEPANDNPNYRKKPYKCNKCRVRFVLKSTLTAHSNVHQQLHTCPCGIGFYRSLDLHGHMRLIHSDNKVLKPNNNKSSEAIATTKLHQAEVNSVKELQKENKPTEIEKQVSKSKLKIVCTMTLSFLKIHKINVHIDEDGKYVCPKCDKQFNTRPGFKTHYLIHTDMKPYSCKECGMKFKTSSAACAHQRKHRAPCFVCDYCNKGYYVKTLLIPHIWGHMGIKPYRCKHCGKCFSSPECLYGHTQIHTMKEPHKCRYCNKGCTNTDALRKHERIHTGEKPYICQYCGKAFSDPSSLGAHRRIHTKEIRFICQYCQRGFITSATYRIHIKRHTNQKNYACDICGKRFLLSYLLRQHAEAVHENVRNFECNECGRRFYAKYSLKIHIQERHGDIVLYCHLCMKKFFTECALKKHKKLCEKNGGKKKIKHRVKIVDLIEV